MVEKRLKVLEVMNTINSKVGWKKFTEMVGLTSSQTAHALKELAKTGFVKKVKQGYSLTEKGKTALKALSRVPKGMEFHFYTGIDQYTGLSAKNLQDFCELVKQVDSAALEFHISRGDFENWIKTIFHDTQLANTFTRIRKSKPRGETLRNKILKATQQAYQKFQKPVSTP